MHLLRLGLAWCGFGFAAALSAAEPALPEPLSLPQALSYAPQHPHTQLDPDERQQLPQAATPLYLNCHNLAYNNQSSPDAQRDQAIQAFLAPEVAQQLRIMQRFFDTLLADASSVRDNENMAVYFIPLDRARTRMELGEYSELDVAQLDADYQVIRQQQNASGAAQRLTRSLLAQAVNHPTDLPSELNPPKLPPLVNTEAFAGINDLVATSLKQNSWLQQQLAQASKAQRQVLEMQLRQHLLEQLLRLDIYQVAAERAAADMLWRDYYLERSRTLYEQEVRSDLGDAMTQQSRARLQQEQIRYCHVLSLAQLQALQGKALWPIPDLNPKEPKQ